MIRQMNIENIYFKILVCIPPPLVTHINTINVAQYIYYLVNEDYIYGIYNNIDIKVIMTRVTISLTNGIKERQNLLYLSFFVGATKNCTLSSFANPRMVKTGMAYLPASKGSQPIRNAGTLDGARTYTMVVNNMKYQIVLIIHQVDKQNHKMVNGQL